VVGVGVTSWPIEEIPDQSIQHSPIFGHPDLADNRAHTDVHGPKEQDPEVRRRFQRIATFVLSLPVDG
jgi:hypothetical protein